MSSQKSSKADLLVRVRYQNSLPPPPFPPKLLTIQTDPARYATYDFLLPLAAERELPMVVDAELGMPLELGKHDDGYWTGDFSRVAPDTSQKPELHEDDLALLVEPAGAVSAASTGLLNPTSHLTPATNLPTIDRKKAEVSWLRRTEYGGSENLVRRDSERATPAKAPKKKRNRLERISAINRTFEAGQRPLSDLRHPTRRDVHAVEDFPILPDQATQGHSLNLLRFSDDPLEKSAETESEMDKLSQSFFRIVNLPTEAVPRLTHYMPKDLEQVHELRSRSLPGDQLPQGEEADYRHGREFEPHGVARELRNEFVMVLDDPLRAAQDAMFEEVQPVERQKAAYITTVGLLNAVRRKRVNRNERGGGTYGDEAKEAGIDFWHNLRVAWYAGEPEAAIEGEQAPQENPDDDPIMQSLNAGAPSLVADKLGPEVTTSRLGRASSVSPVSTPARRVASPVGTRTVAPAPEPSAPSALQREEARADVFERDVEFAPEHVLTPHEAIEVAIPPVLAEAAEALANEPLPTVMAKVASSASIAGILMGHESDASPAAAGISADAFAPLYLPTSTVHQPGWQSPSMTFALEQAEKLERAASPSSSSLDYDSPAHMERGYTPATSPSPPPLEGKLATAYVSEPPQSASPLSSAPGSPRSMSPGPTMTSQPLPAASTLLASGPNSPTQTRSLSSTGEMRARRLSFMSYADLINIERGKPPDTEKSLELGALASALADDPLDVDRVKDDDDPTILRPQSRRAHGLQLSSS